MRSLNALLNEYGTSHQHPTNKRLHWICVPPIVLAVLGLLWCLPVPAALSAVSQWLNWATFAAAAGLVYYLVLSPVLAVGALLAFVALLGVTHELARLPWPLWLTCIVLFVIAWIGQFIGHAVEGKRPSFFKDLQFLLIGPLWLLAAGYRYLRIRY